MNDEIRKCPFCGQYGRQIMTPRSGQMSLKCGCGALGPINYPKTRAIEDWNTRPIEESLIQQHQEDLVKLAEALTKIERYKKEFENIKMLSLERHSSAFGTLADIYQATSRALEI